MTDDHRKPGGGWDLIEDLLAEDEIEKQRAMPAEQRRAAMKERGLDPDRAHTLANEVLAKVGLPTPALAPAPAPAKVIDIATARKKRPVWVLALVAAAVAGLFVAGGGAIVALNTPSPSGTSPVPSVPTAPPGPSPEELAQREDHAQAKQLRALAAADCAADKWADCEKKLGKADALDPAGVQERRVLRMRGQAERGRTAEMMEGKHTPFARSIGGKARSELVARLSEWKGQTVRLACARDPEPSQFCRQLASIFASAGWSVSRVVLPSGPPDAGGVHGTLVEVATDASDATQMAADDLVGGLEDAYLYARGPNDVPPGSDAPLRVTIGVQ